MKYKYQTEIIEAQENRGALGIVEALKNTPFTHEQTIGEYMEGFAFRQREWDGTILRTDTPENFVSDLLGYHILLCM